MTPLPVITGSAILTMKNPLLPTPRNYWRNGMRGAACLNLRHAVAVASVTNA